VLPRRCTGVAALAAAAPVAISHQVQDRLDEAVRSARAYGASWTDIGDIAEITRQSAHERRGATARRSGGVGRVGLEPTTGGL
jgi:hypothetical protein